jgi:hypothetical protein
MGREPIPWLWLGLGIVVTCLALLLAVAVASVFLRRPPLTAVVPSPTIIRLTAPPSSIPLSASPLPSPSIFPTFTPPATPDVSVAPETITVGYYVRVSNTDDVGVSLRGGPSTDNLRLALIPEGATLLVIGGPEEGNGFIWWEVRSEDETDGWVAGDFLVPAAGP